MQQLVLHSCLLNFNGDLRLWRLWGGGGNTLLLQRFSNYSSLMTIMSSCVTKK